MVANVKSTQPVVLSNGQVTQPGLFDGTPPRIVRPRNPRKAKTSTPAPYELKEQAIRKVEATFAGYVTASSALMQCWEGESETSERAALRQYDRSAKALRSFVESALALGVPAVDLMMAIADSLAEGKGE